VAPRLLSVENMPIKSDDLHGNAPDQCSTTVLLIDVINDFEFENGEQLLKLALPVGHNIANLKANAKRAGVPVIYVNDNFGKWQSDLNRIVSHCLNDGVRGEPFVRLVVPDEDDYFVLKPKHSGFYCTSLELLLKHVGSKRLVLAGIAGNNCVLFTANDAYMRDFEVIVPADCVVSETEEENKYALEQMQDVLKADIRESTAIDFQQLLQRSKTKAAEAS
jgi:nicotinamidase-related amidase